ncbi:hypothetical protein GHT06_021520 [Daphnia sinensis]|uniref:Ig-like domain-containing protein n=1 Tax=Daphnia sinensis TaxID=1820382 RepID=A0AAD5KJV6_9CRUS|nr:hypothetical protein GHT06_021520 [Daphnia sinensis]
MLFVLTQSALACEVLINKIMPTVRVVTQTEILVIEENVMIYALRNASGLPEREVAWVRVDTHSILTIHNNVITRNYRIGLAQADGRNWDLKISNVAESDRGFYMYPMRYEKAYTEVVLPPDIIDSESSTDTIVREGSNVSLTCAASGHPQPHILWRREDGAAITRGKLKSNSFDGEVLVLPRVSRHHIGAYLCIASNGVPPSVSKRIVLNVQFAPVLWIPNKLEGTVVGQQVSLVCQIEALPNTDHSRFTMTVTLENEYKMTDSEYPESVCRIFRQIPMYIAQFTRRDGRHDPAIW